MINGCRYCLQHHLASSKRVGLTPEDWERAQAGELFTATAKKKGQL